MLMAAVVRDIRFYLSWYCSLHCTLILLVSSKAPSMSSLRKTPFPDAAGSASCTSYFRMQPAASSYFQAGCSGSLRETTLVVIEVLMQATTSADQNMNMARNKLITVNNFKHENLVYKHHDIFG